jgi:hypothetical protein
VYATLEVMRRKKPHQNFPQKRFLLGRKLRLKGKIKITKLSLALRFILLEQNELPKNQKCNLRSDLKEKITLIKQINRLLRRIKLLRKSNFYSLSDKSQTNEVLLESAFRRLLILLFLYILLLPFASDISSAWQIWQLLQQLLQLLFGSGPG